MDAADIEFSQDEALGYDLRPWPACDIQERVSLDMRERFFLNPDSKAILAVFGYWWETVLKSVYRDLHEDSEILCRQGIQTYPCPQFIGLNHPFWESIRQLKDHCVKVGVDRSNTLLISSVRSFESNGVAMLDNGFEILGYDTVDVMGISCLNNCGQTQQDWQYLRGKYVAHLNEHHLFDSWNIANEYAKDAGRLVPEHEPFAPHLLAYDPTWQ